MHFRKIDFKFERLKVLIERPKKKEVIAMAPFSRSKFCSLF